MYIMHNSFTYCMF